MGLRSPQRPRRLLLQRQRGRRPRHVPASRRQRQSPLGHPSSYRMARNRRPVPWAMAVQRRVKIPRVFCEGGCPASTSEIWPESFLRYDPEALTENLRTRYLTRHEFECQECGTLWETRRSRQAGYASSLLPWTWHQVSPRQQVRYDRTKLREASRWTPFWTRTWRLLNS